MILLVLLCYLFGLSYVPSIYSVDHNENQITYVDSIPQKEAFAFTNYDVYSSGQLMSTENYLQYVNWFWLARGIDLYSIDSEYTSTFDCGSGSVFFVRSDNLTTSNIENVSIREMTCASMEFVAKPKVVQSANSTSQQFIIRFINTLDPTWCYEIYFCYVYNSLLAGTYDWYTNGLYSLHGNHYQDYSSYLSLVVKNWSSTAVSWTRQFFNFYGYDSDVGLQSNYQAGYDSGYKDGYNTGYDAGYDDVYEQQNPYMNSIFAGIFQVGLLPVNVFLSMFNYEVFGINIAGFVSGLLTISVIIIILRFLFGGKKDD